MGKWKLRAKEFSRICDAYSAAFDEIQDLVCDHPDDRQFGVRHTIDLLRSRMIELQQLRVLRLRQYGPKVPQSVLGPEIVGRDLFGEERVCSGIACERSVDEEAQETDRCNNALRVDLAGKVDLHKVLAQWCDGILTAEVRMLGWHDPEEPCATMTGCCSIAWARGPHSCGGAS